MKFILDEELTLNEKGTSRSSVSSNARRASRKMMGNQNSSTEQVAEPAEIDDNTIKNNPELENKLNKAKEVLTKLKHPGDAIDREMNYLRQSINSEDPEEKQTGLEKLNYWTSPEMEARTKNWKDVKVAPPLDDQGNEIDNEEQPQTQQPEEQSQGQTTDQIKRAIADDEAIKSVDNPVQKQLLRTIKRSNNNGYKGFIKGIKSNINNNNFPFTKLMQKPEFARALGVNVSESLTEANAFTSIATRVNPNTFRKFATVYNTFLDNGKVINDLNYIDDSQSIIYDPKLYSRARSLDDIENAIEIDLSAKAVGGEQGERKRKELRAAADTGKVDQVSGLKTNYNSTNTIRFSDFEKYFNKYSIEDQEKMIKALNANLQKNKQER